MKSNNYISPYYSFFAYDTLEDPVYMNTVCNPMVQDKAYLLNSSIEFCGQGYLTIVPNPGSIVTGRYYYIKNEDLNYIEETLNSPDQYKYSLVDILLSDKMYSPTKTQCLTFTINQAPLKIAAPDPRYFKALSDLWENDWTTKHDQLRQALYRSKIYENWTVDDYLADVNKRKATKTS